MYIPVKEKNTVALRFYARHGFVAIDKIDAPIDNESAINIIKARKKVSN